MRLFQIKTFVIEPTLQRMGSKYATRVAVQLLLDTIAVESQGKHIDQRLSSTDETLGPAIGLYQIEPATHHDVFVNFLLGSAKHSMLRMKVLELRADHPDPHTQLATNLSYATAVARTIYFRAPEALPDEFDLDGIWEYYKKHWNSFLGATDKEQFMWHHRAHVAPII